MGEETIDFVKQLLCVDVESRLSAAEALKHDWLQASLNQMHKLDDVDIVNENISRLSAFKVSRAVRAILLVDSGWLV